MEKNMKVYVDGKNNVSKIEFCCPKMAQDILLCEIQTRRWTDHPLVFWQVDNKGTRVGRPLKYCPNCGSKIDNKV